MVKNIRALIQQISESGDIEDLDELLTAAFDADTEPVRGKVTQLEEALTEKDAVIESLNSRNTELAARNFELTEQLPTSDGESSDTVDSDNDDDDTTVDDLFENGVY